MNVDIEECLITNKLVFPLMYKSNNHAKQGENILSKLFSELLYVRTKGFDIESVKCVSHLMSLIFEFLIER